MLHVTVSHGRTQLSGVWYCPEVSYQPDLTENGAHYILCRLKDWAELDRYHRLRLPQVFFSRLLVSDVFSDVFSNGFRFPSKFVVKSSLGRSTRKLPSCHFRFHLIFKVILKIKFTVKRRGTGCRPEITSVPLPKWSETIVTLHEQLTQP